MQFTSKYVEDIRYLCKKYRVATLHSFGSINSDRFTDESDIDLIVDFETDDPIEYSNNYFDFKFELQKLLKRSVDLLETKALKNPYLKKNIDNSKVLIYGRAN